MMTAPLHEIAMLLLFIRFACVGAARPWLDLLATYSRSIGLLVGQGAFKDVCRD